MSPKRISLDETPKFITKLYDILMSDAVNDIKWSESSESFIIPDKEKFVKNSLKALSKTNDYSSFVRQLNNYNFSKIKNENHFEEYAHPLFKKNRFYQLNQIQRSREINNKPTEVNKLKEEVFHLREDINFINQANYELSKEVHVLRDKIETQQKNVDTLIQLFSKAFQFTINNEATKLALEDNVVETKSNKNEDNPENKTSDSPCLDFTYYYQNKNNDDIPPPF
ncbi:DNA-binding heat shock factor [Spraguea lophii 42_110]|uniref:DNA-binding heat shock factor n=1 Tax=Spraguea lophii (strain 42_110) TaxID=1358809 RepID=S7XVD5_SPRLO|nr:DNA-binding heat shock factor [Spraguea lophii 42_110]